MHRLSNGTQSNTAPLPPAVIGTPGFPTEGDPATGTIPSELDYYWDYALAEEICHVIESQSIVLDKANNLQLLAALNVLINKDIVASFTNTLAAEGTPGIVQMPGGAIIQCFPTPVLNVALANVVYGYNLVFPEQFPAYCSAIVAADGGVDGTTWGGFSAVTSSGCGATVWSVNPNNVARGFCMAIGR